VVRERTICHSQELRHNSCKWRQASSDIHLSRVKLIQLLLHRISARHTCWPLLGCMIPIAIDNPVAWCLNLSCTCALQKRLNGSRSCLGRRLFSASEVTTLRRYTNLFIIIIIIGPKASCFRWGPDLPTAIGRGVGKILPVVLVFPIPLPRGAIDSMRPVASC